MPDADALKAQVEKLSPQPGDVLLVKVPLDITTAAHHRLIEVLVWLHGECGFGYLVVQEGVEVSVADEESMRQAGWVRAPKMREFL